MPLNPGRIYRYLKRVRWKKEVDMTARFFKWPYEQAELEILVRFLKSIERDILLLLECGAGITALRPIHKTLTCCVSNSNSLFQTACHESGHVVIYWLSQDPNTFRYVTIVPDRNFAGRIEYDFSTTYVETADTLFSKMCTFLGGGISEQLLAPAKWLNLQPLANDIVIIASLSYKLARMTVQGVEEKDLMTYMRMYFWRAYAATYCELRQHLKQVKTVSYALFVEKELCYWEILKLLGPRPELEISWFEIFAKDQIYRIPSVNLPFRYVCPIVFEIQRLLKECCKELNKFKSSVAPDAVELNSKDQENGQVESRQDVHKKPIMLANKQQSKSSEIYEQSNLSKEDHFELPVIPVLPAKCQLQISLIEFNDELNKFKSSVAPDDSHVVELNSKDHAPEENGQVESRQDVHKKSTMLGSKQ